MKSRPFAEAREFVLSLKLKSSNEWAKYCQSGRKPRDIPHSPYRVYKNQWNGWGDWLGTGYVANRNRKYRSFEEAVNFVRKLGIKSRLEWVKYSKSREKPSDIPTQPRGIYKENWKGWGDWLGTGYVANFDRKYMSFEEARKYVHSRIQRTKRLERIYKIQ